MSRYSCGLLTSSGKHLDSVCTSIEGDLTRLRLTPHIPNLPSHLRTALRSLRSDPRLVVTKVNKGDVVVLLDAPRYMELAWRHLNDSQTYTLLSEDPTQSIVSNFNRYLKHCLTNKVINTGVFDRVRLLEDTNTQIIYFCQKFTRPR